MAKFAQLHWQHSDAKKLKDTKSYVISIPFKTSREHEFIFWSGFG